MSEQHTSLTLKDVLYNKSHLCPICDNTFTAKAIKVGKNQIVSIDSDLYARYSIVNPLLYDVLLCPHCGYAALNKSFDTLLPKQKEWVREHLAAHAKPHASYEYITLEEGIYRHKMALLSCITKKSKLGEQSYIALHIAWLYRDLSDTKNEDIFLKRALEGLDKTLSTERFPLFGIDELTLMYMLADISYRLGDPFAAKKYLSTVIVNSSVSPRVKERALDLKEKLKL